MEGKNGTNGNDKIEALRKREAALKAAIAAEQVKQQKARARLEAREFSTVGEALCKYAGQSPDFKLMLKQVLASAVTDEPTRKFLSGRGWL
jgi:tRNA A37 threonylcarbamoyladenosine dehydratase